MARTNLTNINITPVNATDEPSEHTQYSSK